MNIRQSASAQDDFQPKRMFSERLAAERKRLGHRSADFAALMEIRSATQSSYENGHSVPDALYLIRACELGMDACYLLTGVRAGGQNLSEPAQQLIDTASRLSPKAARAMQALIEAMEPGRTGTD